MNFIELCKKFGTDKHGHEYDRIYDDKFKMLREKELLIIEIGVFRGASLSVLSSYFQNSVIVGLDINEDAAQYEDKKSRINVRIGNQTDDKFLQSVIDEFGNPDIVIDDGSHICRDVIVTFECLWNSLNSGGLYIIEDTHTSYDPTGFYHATGEITTMQYFSMGAHSINQNIIRKRWGNPVNIHPEYSKFKDLESVDFRRKVISLRKKE